MGVFNHDLVIKGDVTIDELDIKGSLVVSNGSKLFVEGQMTVTGNVTIESSSSVHVISDTHVFSNISLLHTARLIIETGSLRLNGSLTCDSNSVVSVRRDIDIHGSMDLYKTTLCTYGSLNTQGMSKTNGQGKILVTNDYQAKSSVCLGPNTVLQVRGNSCIKGLLEIASNCKVYLDHDLSTINLLVSNSRVCIRGNACVSCLKAKDSVIDIGRSIIKKELMRIKEMVLIDTEMSINSLIVSELFMKGRSKLIVISNTQKTSIDFLMCVDEPGAMISINGDLCIQRLCLSYMCDMKVHGDLEAEDIEIHKSSSLCVLGNLSSLSLNMCSYKCQVVVHKNVSLEFMQVTDTNTLDALDSMVVRKSMKLTKGSMVSVSKDLTSMSVIKIDYQENPVSTTHTHVLKPIDETKELIMVSGVLTMNNLVITPIQKDGIIACKQLFIPDNVYETTHNAFVSHT